MSDNVSDTNMTDVAASIAQENVDLKNDLRDLIEKLDGGDAPDQWFADELRSILENYE